MDIVLFFTFYLIFINFLFKKFYISLDKEVGDEKHKTLLRKDTSVPLSGTVYFLPLIIILFYNIDLLLIICCCLLFILGYLADLKIITSYKKRLIAQFFFISAICFLDKGILVNTRFDLIDNLMNYNILRILICTFFFMVLINGYNLIDGTNCLCSLNFLIVTIFLFLLLNDLNIEYSSQELKTLIIAILVYVIFNFFGKNFLGDGAVYGVSFLLGYVFLKISLINISISPYFIANLLWYPAFENLFSIIRRNLFKKNNYLPDTDHLHHLIFKYFNKKNFIKNDILRSSIVGIFINLYLIINYLIGFKYYHHTSVQITIMLLGIMVYITVYFKLDKKLKHNS